MTGGVLESKVGDEDIVECFRAVSGEKAGGRGGRSWSKRKIKGMQKNLTSCLRTVLFAANGSCSAAGSKTRLDRG